jgi:HPt (histidine-containing phosphotransfer) domain-containing protein
MKADRERCLAAGMNDFVPKPVSKRVLHEALKRWLRAPNDAVQGVAKLMACNQPILSRIKQDAAVVFDRAGVMQRLEGDRELASAIMEVFLDDLPRQIECLKDLVAGRDANGAGRQAHSIKGAAANVGGERMRRVALEMETSADAGNLAGVACRLGDLETEFVLLKDALEHERSAELSR